MSKKSENMQQLLDRAIWVANEKDKETKLCIGTCIESEFDGKPCLRFARTIDGDDINYMVNHEYLDLEVSCDSLSGSGYDISSNMNDTIVRCENELRSDIINGALIIVYHVYKNLENDYDRVMRAAALAISYHWDQIQDDKMAWKSGRFGTGAIE